MKVFLSWAGDHSRQVAEAFQEWLPLIINDIELFLSTEIDAGARWQSEVAAQLESTDFGIVFVTVENQARPWLNFEAGALAKSVEASRVVPLAINLTPSDIPLPLGQFQAQPFTQDGVKRTLLTLNKALQKPLNPNIIELQLKKWWEDLDSKVDHINDSIKTAMEARTGTGEARKHIRDDRQLLEEILTTVRQLAGLSSQALPPPSGMDLADIRWLAKLLAASREPRRLPANLDVVTATIQKLGPGTALSLYSGHFAKLEREYLEARATEAGVTLTWIQEDPDPDTNS